MHEEGFCLKPGKCVATFFFIFYNFQMLLHFHFPLHYRLIFDTSIFFSLLNNIETH